jgi:hypothetical protein
MSVIAALDRYRQLSNPEPPSKRSKVESSSPAPVHLEAPVAGLVNYDSSDDEGLSAPSQITSECTSLKKSSTSIPPGGIHLYHDALGVYQPKTESTAPTARQKSVKLMPPPLPQTPSPPLPEITESVSEQNILPPPLPQELNNMKAEITAVNEPSDMPLDSTSDDLIGKLSDSVHRLCIECGDQPAVLACTQCEDDFCSVCFLSQHRKGNRSKHVPQSYSTVPTETLLVHHIITPPYSTRQNVDVPLDEKSLRFGGGSSWFEGRLPTAAEFLERSKYMPLRLNNNERKYLALLEAALDVSEYTDNVDIITYAEKHARIREQLRLILQYLCGLLTCADHAQGKKKFSQAELSQHESFFQNVFEVGRRYKVCNPDKMRTTYGKLMYVLMDAQLPEIQNAIGMHLVVPIRTVNTFLYEKGQLKLFEHELLPAATGVLHSELTGSALEVAKAQKAAAVQTLIDSFQSPTFTETDIRLVLNSINDSHSFLASNRDPIDAMLAALKENFDPNVSKPDLAIRAGTGPSRLTHSHSTQYHFVFQTLTLWRNITHDLFKLWMLAEMDLTSTNNSYSLRHTGQGMCRVQSCPRVAEGMQQIVSQVERICGGWVGSSAVHLGDRAVPNALIFIDKYNQISRILNPLVSVLKRLDHIEADADLKHFLIYDNNRSARLWVLTDFFRHGFNGSGADNNFDAGSCIDGRLTSAWNWCSNLNRKSYAQLFSIAGFMGFDGSFE